MKISLKPAAGSEFVFPLLPEKVQVKYAAKYKSFDIISKGTIDVPRGSDVVGVSWDGEFFGRGRRNLAGVDAMNWKEPDACVQTLRDWLDAGTELTLIVSGTWINMDVTVASFDAAPHGGYGDISYSVTFKKVRPLKIYTAKELKIGKKKKAKPRAKKKKQPKKKYVLKKGDTLNKIALKNKTTWTDIYMKNKPAIERAAIEHGFPGSNRGGLVFAGTKLMIP